MQPDATPLQDRRRTGIGAGFGRLWWAALAAGGGDGIRLGAFPLLAAALTSDPALVAGVSFAGTLPWLLVGPITGVLTDRGDRRRILWTVDLARAAIVVALAVATALGGLSLPLLMAAAFLLGSAQSLRDNAAFAIVPSVVAARSLEKANGRIQSAVLITEELVGPPLGVLLFGLSAAVPLAIGATAFAVAAWLLFGLAVLAAQPTTSRQLTTQPTTPQTADTQSAASRTAEQPGPRPGWRGVLADAAFGFRWLSHHRLLRALCVLSGLSNLAVMSVVSIAVLYAFEVLHVGRTLYAMLLVVIAAGGLLGALSASVISARLGRGLALQLAFVLSPLAFVVTWLTSNPYLAAVAFAMVGMSVTVCNVISVSLRHALVPDALLGRVNAAFRLVSLGLVPLGAAMGGALGHQFGLRAPFLAGALVLGLGLLLAARATSNRAVRAAVQPGVGAEPASREVP